jgi:hypothetical protein
MDALAIEAVKDVHADMSVGLGQGVQRHGQSAPLHNAPPMNV